MAEHRGFATRVRLGRRRRTDAATGGDAGRDIGTDADTDAGGSGWSACYAPHSSMYLDQFGKARACCQNTGVYLGDVTRQTLREIWDSAEAERLRTALEAGDHSAGCEFCEWQVREGNADIVYARRYDPLRPAERRPTWPRQLELSLTNTCNLACAMCNGDWSSTIRAKREQRPAIPVVYGDAFFEQLAEFLPHLESVEFLGGEPFLGKEPLRVMEMLAELPRPPKVAITTNGTVFTDRVRRIITALQPAIVVSLDGATPETYDAIRVGAHLPDVLANIDRYRAALGPDQVSIAHCLMTTNWHEYADLLALAEDRALDVGVNVVRFPESLSLYQLDADDLARVVERLHATEVHLTGTRLELWHGHLAALANRLEVLRSDDPDAAPGHGLPGASALAVLEAPPGEAARPLSRWPWLPFPEEAPPTTGAVAPAPPSPAPGDVEVTVGTDGVFRVVTQPTEGGLDLSALDGGRNEAFGEWLRERCGPPESWEVEPRRQGVDDDRFVLRLRPVAPGGPVRIEGRAERDEEGRLVAGRFTIGVAEPG